MKLAVLIVGLGLLSGCSPEVGREEANKAEASVRALVAECETQWAPNAAARAREVIACGGATLPFLVRAWKKAKDPDAMVWSWAAIACIRKGWTLDEYKQKLVERLVTADVTKGARDVPYMVNAYVLGYAPAFFMLRDVSGYEGAQNLKHMVLFGDTTPTYDLIFHLGKIRLLHAEIRLLEVGDKETRGKVVTRLIAENDHMTGSYLDDRDRYTPEKPPQSKEEKEEIRRLWKEARAYVDEPSEERQASIARLKAYTNKFLRATPEEIWQEYLKSDARNEFRKYRQLYEMKWPLDE